MIKKQLYLLLAIVFILPSLALPAANAAPDETTKTWLVAGDSITSDFYCRGYKKYDDYLKYYFNIEQGNNFRFVKTAVPGFKVEDYLNNFDDIRRKSFLFFWGRITNLTQKQCLQTNIER